MVSNQEEVLEHIAADQEYGDQFISFPEQGESQTLSEEQISILLQDEDRLDGMGLSFETNLEDETKLVSSNTVGAARIGSGRDWIGVQVVPKIGNAAFLRMVEFSSFGFATGESAIRTDIEDAPTVDTVVHYFAKRIREFLRDYHHRAYEYKTSTDEGQIKGRILVDDYVRHSLPKCKPQVVPHKYVDFTADNFANQVVAYAVHLALQLAKGSSSATSNETLEILQECRRHLAGVSVRRITPNELGRYRFTRENEAFKPIFQLCELIINNSSVTLGKRQRVPFFSFNLEMSNVFERYVAALLTEIYGERFTGNKPSLSYPVRHYGKEIELDGLYSDDEHTLVVEAKYKVVEEAQPDVPDDNSDPMATLSGSKLSRADLYQTIAYTSHQDIRADAAILVYPAWEESNQSVEVYDDISSFGWSPESTSGVPVYPVTINLGKPPGQITDELKAQLSPHIDAF